MARKSTVLKDIALATGVSVKTASRALNNHPDVSRDTRDRVLHAARELSYFPNMAAKSMRTRRSAIIGYIVPDITSSFFAKVGLGIEKALKSHGYSLLMSFTEESQDNEADSLGLMLSQNVDGIVLATVGTTAPIVREIIGKYQVPVVVIDNRVEGLETDVVLHDNVLGARLLTGHLIEHGHSRIACVTGPLNETSGYERLEGYRKALAEAGLPWAESLVRIADWRIPGGFEATMSLLSGAGPRPGALFVANSVMALGAYKAIKKLGLRVPEDVAVVSFDSLDFTEILDPPLTTLKEMEAQIAAVAADLLLKRIGAADAPCPTEIHIAAELQLQHSCGC